MGHLKADDVTTIREHEHFSDNQQLSSTDEEKRMSDRSFYQTPNIGI